MPAFTRLPRTTPESVNVPASCIKDFVDQFSRKLDSPHSFMLLKDGMVIAEGWWKPYRPECRHMLFSLSKSFTSTAVGLAVAENYLTIDDPVLGFFPEEAPRKVSDTLAAMKVRHLLSMSSGHAKDTTEEIMFASNPFKAFLGLEVEFTPGTHFVYNSGATFMLAAILQKLTGQTLTDYLTPRLFDPLGIQDPYWESHPYGVNFGGWGLNLKTEDIARFGQLYLQKGEWQGRQLVPAAWVETATSKHISNGSDPESDWAQGYGYQFWRCQHGAYRGDGAFGQYCVVLPEQDAVLVITGGMDDMQGPLDIVWDTLLPVLKGKVKAAPGSPPHSAIFEDLELKTPKGNGTSPLAGKVSKKVFNFEPNPDRIETAWLDFEKGEFTYKFQGQKKAHKTRFGSGEWVDSKTAIKPPEMMLYKGEVNAAASGAWTEEGVFTLALCLYETPFVFTLEFKFDGEDVGVKIRQNNSFGPLVHAVWSGKMEGNPGPEGA